MKKIILLCLLFSLSIIYATISNIEEEGLICKSSLYYYGSAIHDNNLYCNTQNGIEKYNIDGDGSLTLICDFPIYDILHTFTIAGDSLYLIVSYSSLDIFYLQIIDISSEVMELTSIFEIPRPSPTDSENAFAVNDDYVFITPFYHHSDPYIMYNRHTNEIEDVPFEITSLKYLSGQYLYDLHYLSQTTFKLRVRDISSIDDPILIYEYPEYMTGDSYLVWLNSINDTTLSITSSLYFTSTRFFSIADINNPILINQYSLNSYDVYFDAPPLIINEDFIFYSGINVDDRLLYDISDLLTPYEISYWFVNGSDIVEWGFSASSFLNHFYEMQGELGIARYNVENLPINNPIEYIGENYNYFLMISLCDSYLLFADGFNIYYQSDPYTDPVIIYESEDPIEYNVTFACLGDKTIIAHTDDSWMNWDVYIVSTTTGEILSETQYTGWHMRLKYCEPYVFWRANGFIEEVYRIQDNNIQLVTTIENSNDLYVYDSGHGFFWVNKHTDDEFLYIYDRETFTEITSYPKSLFTTNNQHFNPCFIEDYVIVYEVETYGADQFLAQLFYHPTPDTLILIDSNSSSVDEHYFNINGDIAKTHSSDPIEFSYFSPTSFTEPYYTFQTPGSFSAIYNTEFDRFYSTNWRRFISYHYDFESSDIDSSILSPVISLTNFPNPFNPVTRIIFSIHQDSDIKINVYNIKGQLVKNLIDDKFGSGEHHIYWNSTNNQNKKVSSGVYFYNLIIDNKQSITRKMVLVE